MARKIAVEIVGDSRSLEKAFARSSKSAKRFQGDVSKTGRTGRSAFGGLGRMAGFAAGAIGTAGLVGAARAAFTEMADAQKVTAQTNAVLKSTGKAANVSAKHVDDLANSLLNVSGVDDEIIKSGENVLLTFRDIRNQAGKGNKIFDQATRATLDLSVALKKDMPSAAILVGKALNDPVKGMTALTRAGVQFTDQQKETIKSLVESGDKIGAQKIILAELTKEFGGSAKAAGDTLPGKLNILKQTLLNLGGSIANILTPQITKLVDKMVAWLSKSKNQKQVLDTVKAAADAVGTAVRLLAGAFTAMNKVTGSAKHTFELLLGLFIAFKALKLVSYIAGMTKAMRGFAGASAAANASGAGAGGLGGAGKVGRFGRLLGGVGAVAVGAPLVAGAIRKIPGWDKTFKGIGGAIAGATVARGDRDIHVHMNVDGKKIATVTARHNENELAHRRKGRAHQRKSRR